MSVMWAIMMGLRVTIIRSVDTLGIVYNQAMTKASMFVI